jgi:uncharacterized protein DUF262
MTISHLLRCIKDGRIVLPSIQRDFIWPVKRIYRLLDSVLQGYPIGIVLLWETYQDLPYRNFTSDVFPGQLHPIQANQQNRKLGIVLDGQQRVQSLFTSLCGTHRAKSLYLDLLSGKVPDPRTRQKYDFRFMDGAEYAQWRTSMYLGLNQPRLTPRDPQYFACVADLHAYGAMQKSVLRKQLVKDLSLSGEDQERLEMNLCRFDEVVFRNCNILKVAVIDEDLPSDAPNRKTEADVLEIFLRINHEGAPLSRSELTFSMLKLSWKDSAISLPEFVKQINDGNYFDLDTTFVIRCLFAVSGLGTRFDPDLLRKASTARKIQLNFPQCADAIRSTIDTVMKDCWCSSSDLIGGPSTLVPFVYYLFHTPNHEVSQGQMTNFRKALHLFGFTKPFTGLAEGRIRKFIRQELVPLAERGDFTFPFTAAVWWAKTWEGCAAFASLPQSNPRLALHLLQGWNGSKTHYWRNAAELDHIFPRSELSRRGFGDCEINHFANLWILPKGKNMNKSNQPPAEYLSDVDEAELRTALIDRELLSYSSFKSFLRRRGQQIVEVLKERLEFSDRDFRVPVFTFRPLRKTTRKLPPARAPLEILPTVLVERKG